MKKLFKIINISILVFLVFLLYIQTGRITNLEIKTNILKNDLESFSLGSKGRDQELKQNLDTAYTIIGSLAEEADKPKTIVQNTYVTGKKKFNVSSVAQSIVVVLCDEGQGSGIIIQYTDSKTIVTNSHVVGNSQTCRIMIPGHEDELYILKPTINVPSMDYAGFEISNDTSFKGINNICEYGDYELGDSITSLGYPLFSNNGMGSITVTDGIISGVMPNESLRTTLKLNPGNSGGAAFLDNGCLVGITTAVYNGTFENYGIVNRPWR